MSHSAEKVRGGTLKVVTEFGHTIFCQSFFVSQHQKTLQGKPNPSVLSFGKFPVANKFMDKKGGVSEFSVETFLSHSAGKIRSGTP